MEENQVHIEHTFTQSPEQIFNAWVRPQIIKKWLFKSDKNKIVHVINDPKPNGAFSILEKTEQGELIDHFGKYYIIQKPWFLSFSLVAPKHFKGVTVVDITINPKEDGCQLTFNQTGVDPKIVEDSWKKMFSELDKVVSKS